MLRSPVPDWKSKAIVVEGCASCTGLFLETFCQSLAVSMESARAADWSVSLHLRIQ